MEQGLIYTRLGNPIGRGRGRRNAVPTGPTRGSADGRRACPTSARASPRCSRSTRRRPRWSSSGTWYAWGDLGADRRRDRGRVVEPGERVARAACATGPPQVGLLLGLLRAGACVVTVNPERGTRTGARRPRVARRRHRRRRSRRPRRARAERRAGWSSDDARCASTSTGDAPVDAARRAAAGRRGRDAHERHDRAAEARRRSPTTRSTRVLARRQALRAQRRRRRAAALAASPS